MTEAVFNQRDCEMRMYHGGIKRAEGMMQKAEEGGRAATNPYAKEMIDEYVLPLSQALTIELDVTRAGIRHAHATLMRGMDPDAVAFLAVRTAINAIFREGTVGHRQLAYEIGKTLHNELVLVQIEESYPELYHTLSRDFQRRLSKDERHRMTVYKMQARKAGMLIVEWPVGARDQVGMYLLGMLEGAGLLTIENEVRVGKKTLPRNVALSPDLMDRVASVKSYVAITMPVYGPCVERPLPWINPNEGGFHTREMRRCHHALVRHRLNKTALYREAQMPIVLEAVNALQDTRWQVNGEMLEIVRKVSKHFSVGDIVNLSTTPKPAQPLWLPTADADKTTWTEPRLAEFKAWKHTVAEWHTARKIAATSFARFYSATRAADMFLENPTIHFVYFADSRGRLYPMTYGLNPQGSDIQRALLRFADGLPVDTPDAIRWFHVQGANKWGFDKATLEERHQWVVERQDLILSFAEDPINNRGWAEADSPLQFLSWCLEYRAWVQDSTGQFVSRLPISMDGSCNGLQNLSALLRDEIGGEATNLTANKVMQDIYRRVAEATMRRLNDARYAEDPTKERLRKCWLTVGVSRSVVKRSVMTTPYGVTKRSAIDYVIEDTLSRPGGGLGFEKHEYMKAAMVLMDSAWPAIGDVVVKGREAMDWLRKCSRAILRSCDKDDPLITWVSPSGFPASQAYFEAEVHRIHTLLHGVQRIRVHSELDEADENKHVNGLAPNFVHSMDAAHLHLTTAACKARGIHSLAMIHDDYGTHAANAQVLFNTIRTQFVRMYQEHDPIAEFVALYPCVPAPPTRGTLDIMEVLDSDYFFS